MIGPGLVALLAVWFAVSVYSQIVKTKLRYVDVFGLIPSWSFFAPNPGTHDFRLLYRDVLEGGTLTAWREVEPARGGPWRWIWHPEKRRGKVIADVCTMVMEEMSDDPTALGPVLSVPYLVLAQYVATLPASPLANARQFLVAHTTASHRAEEAKILMTSHAHPLPTFRHGTA